ncbi:MAG: TlpA disulfide reductase family protein [Pseudorhodoplanes sp.]
MLLQWAPAGRGVHFFQYRAFACALGLWLCAAVPHARSTESPADLKPWPGDAAAPRFVLDDLTRQPVSLSDIDSEIVIVHFFATWCEPCRDELPALTRLVSRSAPAQLRVISISVAEVDIRVRRFVETMPVNFPVLLDRDRSVARSWGVSALPTSFVLDRNLTPHLVVERDYGWDGIDVATLRASIRDGRSAATENRKSKTQKINGGERQ